MAEKLKNVILIGQSIGCNALVNLVNRRGMSATIAFSVTLVAEPHTPS